MEPTQPPSSSADDNGDPPSRPLDGAPHPSGEEEPPIIIIIGGSGSKSTNNSRAAADDDDDNDVEDANDDEDEDDGIVMGYANDYAHDDEGERDGDGDVGVDGAQQQDNEGDNDGADVGEDVDGDSDHHGDVNGAAAAVDDAVEDVNAVDVDEEGLNDTSRPSDGHSTAAVIAADSQQHQQQHQHEEGEDEEGDSRGGGDGTDDNGEEGARGRIGSLPHDPPLPHVGGVAGGMAVLVHGARPVPLQHGGAQHSNNAHVLPRSSITAGTRPPTAEPCSSSSNTATTTATTAALPHQKIPSPPLPSSHQLAVGVDDGASASGGKRGFVEMDPFYRMPGCSGRKLTSARHNRVRTGAVAVTVTAVGGQQPRNPLPPSMTVSPRKGSATYSSTALVGSTRNTNATNASNTGHHHLAAALSSNSAPSASPFPFPIHPTPSSFSSSSLSSHPISQIAPPSPSHPHDAAVIGMASRRRHYSLAEARDRRRRHDDAQRRWHGVSPMPSAASSNSTGKAASSTCTRVGGGRGGADASATGATPSSVRLPLLHRSGRGGGGEPSADGAPPSGVLTVVAIAGGGVLIGPEGEEGGAGCVSSMNSPPTPPTAAACSSYYSHQRLLALADGSRALASLRAEAMRQQRQGLLGAGEAVVADGEEGGGGAPVSGAAPSQQQQFYDFRFTNAIASGSQRQHRHSASLCGNGDDGSAVSAAQLEGHLGHRGGIVASKVVGDNIAAERKALRALFGVQ